MEWSLVSFASEKRWRTWSRDVCLSESSRLPDYWTITYLHCIINRILVIVWIYAGAITLHIPRNSVTRTCPPVPLANTTLVVSRVEITSKMIASVRHYRHSHKLLQSLKRLTLLTLQFSYQIQLLQFSLPPISSFVKRTVQECITCVARFISNSWVSCLKKNVYLL